MTRLKAVPLIGGVALLLFGCTPGAGSVSPSAAATATPRPSPALVSITPSVTASPVAVITAAPTALLTAVPSASAADDPAHMVPDLEALIPDVIGGQVMHTFSFSGKDYLDEHPYPFLDVLTTAGVSPDDFAVAGAIADHGNFSVQVVRVAGADANLFIEWARSSGATFTEATIGGKSVLTARPDLPEPSYSYVDGEIVYEVEGDPKLVAEFFSTIP